MEPKVTVGSTDPKESAYRVEVPVNIIKGLSASLQGEPKAWRVLHFQKSKWCPQEVVIFTDEPRHTVVCQINPTRWYRLSCKQNIPLIEAILNWKQYDSAMLNELKPFDAERWLQYLQNFSFYYKGDHRAYLTKDSMRQVDAVGRMNLWLQGSEKNPAVFRALCNESVIAQPDGSVEVRCNLITGWGGGRKMDIKGQAQ